MQSGDAEVLQACVVEIGSERATTIWGRRGIVALPTDLKTIFSDPVWNYAYVELPVGTRDRVPVHREILEKADAATLDYAGRTHHGLLERKGEPVEYAFTVDETTRGAPVVSSGQLVGVVTGGYGSLIDRVVPIGMVLDRIEFEELDGEAKAVFARAEGIRQAVFARVIHMEHLVYALRLIRDTQVLRRVEEEAETKLPEEYDVALLSRMPDLSKHVREALDNAIRARGNADETSIHDLYEGVFATDCGVVKILIQQGVEIPNPTIAGYASDVPRADSDPFGVHKYARALCTVLAADKVTPPLSIGLFAPWGAGKTSFMKAMSDRFEQINELTARNPRSAYRPNIVQLWFNAWHYTEQNLIASLADAVFEGLDTALTLPKKNADPERTDEVAFEKQALEKKLETADEAAAESQRKLSAARSDVAQIDREIDAIKKDERTLEEVKRAGVALSKEEAERYARKAAKALGSEEKSTDELLKDAATTWATLRRLLKSPRGWLITIACVAVAALLVWLAKSSAAWIRLIPAAALVVSILGQLTRVISALNKAREATLADRIKEKEAAELRARAAEEEMQRAEARKKKIEKQLSDLSPRESMASFVRERRSSGTYARQLSVAAEAHRDFRRLSAYVKQNDVGVGRIVLYIDDLDRCPEEKVVEVLHAVHLLLAFDLFVVIVAVDSKWLLHSLKQYSTAFAGRGSWRSTPLNYLEKIIQIPFTLDPMTETGYATFINDLTRPSENTIQPGDAAHNVAPAAQSAGAQQPGASAASAFSTLPPPVDPNPAPLNFSPEEKAFMAGDLYALMSSPRNTKRFANVYRLIRATLSSSTLEALVDPVTKPYEPLMVLVALITNYPEEAAAVLAALKRSPDGIPLRDCIADTSLSIPDVPRDERPAGDFRPWLSHVSRFLIQTGDR